RPHRDHDLRAPERRRRGDREEPGGRRRPDALVPAHQRPGPGPPPAGGDHRARRRVQGVGRPGEGRVHRRRTRASVPRWKLSRERRSFGEWAPPPGWVSPLTISGAPTASWKSTVTGIEPPVRTRT